MNLLIRSELRKTALRPVTLIVVAVFLLATLVITWTGQGFGHLQWGDAVRNYQFVQQAGECPHNNPAVLAKCRIDAQTYDLPLAQHLLDYSRNIVTAAAPGQSPIGAFGWVAGLFGSVPGLLAAFLLAAAGTAAEWERGTAARLFLAENRLDRVLLAKAAGIWLTLMAAMALAGVLTIGYDLAYSAHAYPLTEFIPSTGHLILYTLRRTSGAAFLLAGASAAGVLSAARWRTRGSVIAAGIVCALAANLGLIWPSLWQWLPGGALADLMGFTTQTGIWDHLWGGQTATADAPLTVRIAVAAALVVLVTAALARGRHKQDLV